MKNVLFLMAFLVLGTTALTAQERDRDRIQDQDRTKLVMVNGQMLELRDRAEMRLKEKQTLEDGTAVYPDGTYQARGGKRMKLKDGECLDGDGIIYRNEYQYRYKVHKENMGLTEAQVKERNQNRVHYTVVDGEMLLIRNQAQNRLQEQVDLGNGVLVNPDGSYQSKNQKQLQLQEGECLNMAGELYRNLHQHRKMIVQKNQIPGKKMIKKAVKKPAVQKKRKSTK